MKRLVSLLIIVAALFYVAWPAYTASAIRSALDARDSDALRDRVDFDSVRTSMRPAITTKVESTLDAAAAKAGPAGSKIYAALKTQMMPKIVEAALQKAVTPEMLIRIHSERGTIKDVLDKMIGEQVTKSAGGGPAIDLGGLAGALSGNGAGNSGTGLDAGKVLGGLFGTKPQTETAPKPAAGDTEAKPAASWRNIRGAGLDGPLGVYLKLSKDPTAFESDLTARMSFRGNGWILTGIEPRL
jgi:Protein of unknown function (DUF2939)